MIKITFMGAGSTVFAKNVLGDIMLTDSLHNVEIALYDIDGEVAYCIQPNTKEGVNYNQGTWEDVNLPNSIKERLLLIQVLFWKH